MTEDVEGLIAELREVASNRAALCVHDVRRQSVGADEFDRELADSRAVATVPYVRLVALEALLEKVDHAADTLAGMKARVEELEAGLEPFACEGVEAEYESQPGRFQTLSAIRTDTNGKLERHWIEGDDFRRAHALLSPDRDHG